MSPPGELTINESQGLWASVRECALRSLARGSRGRKNVQGQPYNIVSQAYARASAEGRAPRPSAELPEGDATCPE